jgi:hypothetical protein
MTNTPKHLIVDLEKKTETYVDMTAEEIQQRELDAIAYATRKAEEEAAEAARAEAKASAQAKLAELGLTSEEIEAL